MSSNLWHIVNHGIGQEKGNHSQSRDPLFRLNKVLIKTRKAPSDVPLNMLSGWLKSAVSYFGCLKLFVPSPQPCRNNLLLYMPSYHCSILDISERSHFPFVRMCQHYYIERTDIYIFQMLFTRNNCICKL